MAQKRNRMYLDGLTHRQAEICDMLWACNTMDEVKFLLDYCLTADVSVMISRDCDSRLNHREAEAVSEFMNSDKLFHIMRDHPWHKFNVLGGMFGIKKGLLDNMKDLCASFSQTNNYGTDYRFFDSIINQIPMETLMLHDPFFSGIDFPSPREGVQFVGQVFDENDACDQHHLDVLKAHLNTG